MFVMWILYFNVVYLPWWYMFKQDTFYNVMQKKIFANSNCMIKYSRVVKKHIYFWSSVYDSKFKVLLQCKHYFLTILCKIFFCNQDYYYFESSLFFDNDQWGCAPNILFALARFIRVNNNKKLKSYIFISFYRCMEEKRMKSKDIFCVFSLCLIACSSYLLVRSVHYLQLFSALFNIRHKSWHDTLPVIIHETTEA